MTIQYGEQHLLNTEFNNLSNIANLGVSTFEIVGGALHIAGNAGTGVQLSGQNFVPNQLYALRGRFEVVSGHLRIVNSFNTKYPFINSGPHEWQLGAGIVRPLVASGASGLRLSFITAGEAYFDFLTLNTVISGGQFMPAAASFAYIDYDGDTRQFTLPITDADGTTHDARLAEVEALETAIDGISKLNRTRTDFIIDRDETAGTKPTDQAAQVNIEWKVKFVDSVTQDVETVRIGGADLTLAGILQPGSNIANLAQTQMAAFKTAFEAVVRSSAGNAVTISEVAFLE